MLGDIADEGAEIGIWNQKNKQGWTPLRIAVGVHRVFIKPQSPKSKAQSQHVSRHR